MTYYSPAYGQLGDTCQLCSAGLGAHSYDNECPIPLFAAGGKIVGHKAPWITSYGYPAVAPLVDIKAKKRAVSERTCRRCKTKTLREVTIPGENTPVAMCKLCGTTEEL